MRNRADILGVAARSVVLTVCIGFSTAKAGELATESAVSRSLRIVSIQQDCFDYVFTSVVDGSADRPILAFNHRSGRTFFVRPGDTLGEYTVKSFDPTVDTVFVPSVGANMVLTSGRAVLQSRNGQTLTLRMNEVVPFPGYAARLVSLSDAHEWYVRQGDTLVFEGQSSTVLTISQNPMSVVLAGNDGSLPIASNQEMEQVVLLREAMAQQGLERLDANGNRVAGHQAVSSVKFRSDDPGNRAIGKHGKQRLFFGTEYLYPVEYEVISPVIGPDGRVISPAIPVPRRFEKRESGISIEAR